MDCQRGDRSEFAGVLGDAGVNSVLKVGARQDQGTWHELWCRDAWNGTGGLGRGAVRSPARASQT